MKDLVSRQEKSFLDRFGFVLLLLVGFSLWVLGPQVATIFTLRESTIERWDLLARVGDSFGVINAFLLGLGLVGIGAGLFLQGRQVRAEREEHMRALRVSLIVELSKGLDGWERREPNEEVGTRTYLQAVCLNKLLSEYIEVVREPLRLDPKREFLELMSRIGEVEKKYSDKERGERRKK